MKRTLWTIALTAVTLTVFGSGCTRNSLQRKNAAPDPLLLSKSATDGKSPGVPTSYKVP